MQLTPYLEAVARDLDRATALADEQTRELAHRVVSVLEPGLRLAMVQLLSDVAAQLTAELDGPVITIRMEGRDPSWHIVRDDATTRRPTTRSPTRTTTPLASPSASLRSSRSAPRPPHRMLASP